MRRRPILTKVEVWFWDQLPGDYRHWWIGTTSEKAHCAVVLGDWMLSVDRKGNEWEPIDLLHPWYQNPDYIVDCGYTRQTFLDFQSYETERLDTFRLWWASCARALGFNVSLGAGYCSDTVRRLLSLPGRDLTVDDVWRLL